MKIPLKFKPLKLCKQNGLTIRFVKDNKSLDLITVNLDSFSSEKKAFEYGKLFAASPDMLSMLIAITCRCTILSVNKEDKDIAEEAKEVIKKALYGKGSIK
jgi:hypothetical protein